MEPQEYSKMYQFEQDYWWYKGLRLFLEQEIKNLNFSFKQIKALDAGCGTGGNLDLLKKLGVKKLSGFDLDKQAVKYCHQRGFKKVVQGDLNRIPFPDNSFDLVLCVDVFECQEVDEQKALYELKRILKPNGYLFVTVAAYQWLLSEHDRAVHSVRRYTKKSAAKAFGNSIVNSKYYFFLSFPLIAGLRIIKNIFFSPNLTPQSDLKTLPKIANALLFAVTRLESKLSTLSLFPWGTSLFIVIKK